MNVFEELLNLVLPSRCVLCELSGSNLCIDCKLKLQLNVRSVSRFGITGFATTTYTRQIAALIHEFKEQQQTSLARVFTDAMLPAFENFDLQNCVLVNMPSKGTTFATRGFVPAKILANKLSHQIAGQHKLLVPNFSGLGFSQQSSTRIADQAALSGKDRRTNLVGTMHSAGRPKFDRAILIDDIVTTGATLTEAKRALGDIGVEVLGFVTFAETLPKNMQKGLEESI